MKINVITQVNVPPALGFSALSRYATAIANVEGKDLFRHIAKMNVAAGDLTACATEGKSTKEEVCEEVAALVLRATIFGLAHGMTEFDLMTAIGRETERLVQKGVDARINEQLDATGFEFAGHVALSH